jgi:ribosomal protein L40E
LVCKSPDNISPGSNLAVIVCKKCGNQNPDGETFCLSCHSFLEWSGEKIVEPAPPPPPPPPQVVEPEPTFIDRVKQTVGLEQAKPEPATDGAPATTAPTSASATTPVSVAQPQAAPATVTPVPSVAAVTPPPPATATNPPSQVPAAVLPQAVAPAAERARPAPRHEAPAGPKYRPGDLICGQCGAGNSPERHFCQRCGASLSTAVVARAPWYRRIFPARSAPAAGTRPKGAPVERAWGAAGFRVIALGVIAVVVLAYIVVPPLRDRVNTSVQGTYAAAHRHFAPSTSSVRASDAKASSQLSTHPARLTIDLIKETYWAANTSTDKQPWLRLSFGGPVNIDGILLTSGAGNDYASLARPKLVQLVFSDKSTKQLTLKDDPNPITYDVSAHNVSYVEIHILSVYPSAQSPDVAINEVEFFKIE